MENGKTRTETLTFPIIIIVTYRSGKPAIICHVIILNLHQFGVLKNITLFKDIDETVLNQEAESIV